MRKRNAILGLELVDPSRDLGLWVGLDSAAAARRNSERSSSSSGKEMGGGGEGNMCEANRKRIGRDSNRRSNVGIHGDGDDDRIMMTCWDQR